MPYTYGRNSFRGGDKYDAILAVKLSLAEAALLQGEPVVVPLPDKIGRKGAERVRIYEDRAVFADMDRRAGPAAIFAAARVLVQKRYEGLFRIARYADVLTVQRVSDH